MNSSKMVKLGVLCLFGVIALKRHKGFIAHAAAKLLFKIKLWLIRHNLSAPKQDRLFNTPPPGTKKPSPEMLAFCDLFVTLIPHEKNQQRIVSETQAQAELVDFYEMKVFGHLGGGDERVEHVKVNGIPCAWVSAGDTSKGVVIYLHGGGYVSGTVSAYAEPCGEISKRTNCRILIVDYTVCPKMSLLDTKNGMVKVYQSLLKDIPAKKIAIVGDSAGGGYALGVLQSIVAANIPVPSCGVLLSPWADLSNSGDSYVKNTSDPIFKLKGTFDAFSRTVAKTANLPLEHHEISSMNGSYSGLPPLYVCAGASERLLSDTETIVERAKAANVQIEHEIHPYGAHDYPIFIGWSVPEHDHALEKVCKFISRNLKEEE